MQLSPRFKWFSQPLDRYAIGFLAVLSLVIAILIVVGDRTAPQVRDFSWQGQRIDASNASFVLTFNRPMNRESVERNLKFDPPLAGKISWSSRRMSYTPLAPATYGKTYTIKLENAFDRFANESGKKIAIEPFVGSFKTPNPYFAYIGSQGEEKGRLVLYDVLQKEKRVLTPPNLTVLDFRIYPDRQKILFGAIENAEQSLLDQKLYVVTTGIDREDHLSFASPEIKPILGSDDYQNSKFDLSPDGKNILVQRISRQQYQGYGLWLIKENQQPRSLDNQGGDFMFTPDSASVAIAQNEGIAILPLEPQAPPLDFLPRFGTVLNFSRSGTQAATIKYNKDYTKSLYLVNNQGIQKELIKINGSILRAQFAPQEKTLYCLLTDFEQDATNILREKPYIAAIDLDSAQLRRILELPSQREIQFNVAPDGQAILLNSAVTNNDDSTPEDSARATRIGRTSKVPTQLIVLPINTTDSNKLPQPDVLPLFGTLPKWLP